ncbi:hypothetical protein C3747_28g52 [Trypanosoma cruzi]|uniref:Uncharacterized protein n=2 Tax=Trypanosoma cruzi TaxID=5693 RepID=Q4D6Q8_TRYCC|nr:hypothetical protein, conserved [Trypanosoma cruzi]EAN88210.1 hypothetical protein, conserved [Trypanosoma cruzi]KAF5226537.1 hypothetical protein ECC02_000038 [Trypanosoma cruzi]KAF8295136.1 hypothetical protein TcYC6_0098100 [Trypanosoma cruzi]PWV15607.1 hypothetical protein C3747_28g52 [Trypanosoma cruzi]|eukprot:XP_810061.1 hypothetical protein [Trypanosoma cruzi strain CL Brener]
MDVTSSTGVRWTFGIDSDVPPPEHRISVGFSQIKRAFFTDLMGSMEGNEDWSQGIAVSQSPSAEGSSKKFSIPSDDSDVDGTIQSSELDSDTEIVNAEVSPLLEVTAVPLLPASRRRIVRQYSVVALSALGGALLVGLLKRGIGSVIRTLVSGLAMTQLLHLMGYADVRWKRLLSDLWSVSEYKPTSSPFRAAIAVIAGSIERKIAFFCGMAAGVFLS